MILHVYGFSTHRVKGYEAKLAALNALNSALQKENESLRADLEDAQEPKTDAGMRWWPLLGVCKQQGMSNPQYRCRQSLAL